MTRSETLRQGIVLSLLAATLLLAGAAWAETDAIDAAALQDQLFAPAFVTGEKVEAVTQGTCTATADCYNGSTVSCSSSVGPCSFVDASCPAQRGYAQCAGQKTWCPQCPASSYCVHGASCSGAPRSCGTGPNPGVCYQGACRCYCPQGASCSQDSHCGPANSGGHCVSGSCYCD